MFINRCNDFDCQQQKQKHQHGPAAVLCYIFEQGVPAGVRGLWASNWESTATNLAMIFSCYIARCLGSRHEFTGCNQRQLSVFINHSNYVNCEQQKHQTDLL